MAEHGSRARVSLGVGGQHRIESLYHPQPPPVHYIVRIIHQATQHINIQKYTIEQATFLTHNFILILLIHNIQTNIPIPSVSTFTKDNCGYEAGVICDGNNIQRSTPILGDWLYKVAHFLS